MKSYVKSNTSEQRSLGIQNNRCSPTYSPLSIALWQNGYTSWLYPSTEEFDSGKESMLTIRSINSTQDYELIRLRLYNNERLSKSVKIVVQYCNEQQNTTTFYSPTEKAIISFSDQGVKMLGGNLNGIEMSQYAIQQNKQHNHFQLLRQLEKGKLPLSWLAQGEVCSFFTLETELSPMNIVDGMIWLFQSTSAELVKSLKKEVLPSFV